MLKFKVEGIKETMNKIREDMQVISASNVKVSKNILRQKLADVTPVDTGAARDGWKVTTTGVRNDVEYISDLNQGSSKQAPEFFIEKTILSLK